MLASFLEFIKSLGCMFLLKSSLAFLAFREGVYSQPQSGTTRCCPTKTQGVGKRGSVGSAPAGWWAPRGGHTATLRVERRRGGEGRACGKVLPPSRQHARDQVGFHLLPARPALAESTRGSPRSRSPFPNCCPAQQLDPEQNGRAAVTAPWAQLF